MSPETLERAADEEQAVKPSYPVVKFSPTQAEIRDVAARYGDLSADTPDGYKAVVEAIADVRTWRTGIEKRRVIIKAPPLELCREIDSKAAELTVQLLAIEEPLKRKKKAVDDETDRLRREAEEAAERTRQKALDDARAAEEARLKSIRDAEQARIDEQAAKVAEQVAALKAERESFAAEQRAAREEAERKATEERLAQAAIEQDRQEREARRRAAEEAAARAERLRVADEQRAESLRLAEERSQLEEDQRRVAEQKRRAELAEQQERARQEASAAAAKYAAEEAARLEAIKPDVKKIAAFIAKFRAVIVPEVKSAEASEAIVIFMLKITDACERLERFYGKEAS